MIDRRAFIAASAAWSMSSMAGAQREQAFRIGVIGLSSTADLTGPKPASPTQVAFLKGLRDHGHVLGKDFTIIARGSDGNIERLADLAAEMVAAGVDVIVATGGAVPALKRATTQIPVVMSATNDPVAQGFVRSLSRPGGNITGLSLQSLETMGKRLELIKELVPGPAPIGIVWNDQNELHWEAARAAAAQRGWQVKSFQIRNIQQIEEAFKAAAGAQAGSLVLSVSVIIYPHRERVAELANAYRMPAIYDLRPYVDGGGLISYGPDIADIWRRAASYVDKIMRGANPAELPVEQPTKFELVINGRVAQSLGLKIPPMLLAFADEVLE